MMLANLKRRALETKDWLRYQPTVRGLLGQYKFWRGQRSRQETPQELARSIVTLSAAARLAKREEAVASIQEQIRARVQRLDEAQLDWTEFVPEIHDPRVLKSAILKPYLGPRERGVIFISFEDQWIKLLRHGDRQEFANRYTLVLSPSWNPHHLIHYVFPEVYPGRIVSLISNASDQVLLPKISKNYNVVPLYASHWVHPDRFQPLPHKERSYDLIMVANFARFKRHHVLFAALRKMSRDLRVLLIGQDQDGRSVEHIQEEARWYGVEGRFTVLSNQSYDTVAQALCQSRASIILSRREGSCVVVSESLFANTPVGLLRYAEIGSRAFINEQTGCFLDEGSLAEQVTDLIARSDQFTPRAWAEQHISCFRSSEFLNAALKEQALKEGQEWTQDIAPLFWCPNPCLVSPEDRQRMEPERVEIKQRFNLEFAATGSL